MAETVLIIPMILVILGLLFYFGHLEIRAGHANEMARYEVWRRVSKAPGPHADDAAGNTLLNQAFMGDKAATLSTNESIDDNYFPEDPYTEMVNVSMDTSPDAGALAQAYLYKPDGAHRNPRGSRIEFHSTYADTEAMWQRLTSIAHHQIIDPEKTPLKRAYVRIGNDWAWTADWRASADQWRDTYGGNSHMLHAVRDTYFTAFDANLDSIDGTGSPEGDNPGVENPNGQTLAGRIRDLYLTQPGYAGPIIR